MTQIRRKAGGRRAAKPAATDSPAKTLVFPGFSHAGSGGHLCRFDECISCIGERGCDEQNGSWPPSGQVSFPIDIMNISLYVSRQEFASRWPYGQSRKGGQMRPRNRRKG